MKLLSIRPFRPIVKDFQTFFPARQRFALEQWGHLRV